MSQIGYYFYYPFYLILKFVMESHHIKIKSRHSFYFKRVLLFVSDIDLSAFYQSETSPGKVVDLVEKVKKIKYLIPLLGEVNYYQMELAAEFSEMQNPFELKRDPELLAQLSVTRESDQFDKAIYLLRIFKNDYKNLRKKLDKRFGKLSYCLDVLNPKIALTVNDIRNHKQFKEYLNSSLFQNEHEQLIDFLFKKLLSQESGDEKYEALWNNDLNYFEEKELNPSFVPLVIKHLQWEFWGVFTQVPIIRNDKKVLHHIVRITDLLKKLDTNKSEVYDRHMQKMIDYVGTFRQ